MHATHGRVRVARLEGAAVTTSIWIRLNPLSRLNQIESLRREAAALRTSADRLDGLANDLEDAADLKDSPLLPLDVAFGEAGVEEIAGDEDNPRIREYQSVTAGGEAPDEVPWCSSFLCWVMEQCGIAHPASKASKAWRTWGEEIPIGAVAPGDVAVFDHGGGRGHVGLVVEAPADRPDGKRVLVCAGNTSNRVRDLWMPLDKLHSFRRAL